MLMTPAQGQDNGLDTELDTIGIRLDHPVLCGKCRIKMQTTDNKTFICPKCGKKFVAEE